MGRKGTSKDLLELEHKNPSSSSSSAIDSALLISKKQKKEAPPPPSKPTIAPVPKSEFLDKLKGFLGVMAEANKKLEQEAEEGNSEAFDLEALTGDESQVIEMDLMLGVADLKTPEALKAAEAAIAVKGLANGSSDDESDSNDDESDSDDEDDDELGDKDNPAYVDSLAWVFFKQKKFSEARDVLLEAVKEEDGQHVEIFDHLGDIYLALGQKGDAVKTWEKALTLENQSHRDDARKVSIKKKLESNK